MLTKLLSYLKRRTNSTTRPWSSTGNFIARQYTSYQEYVEHQRSKLDLIAVRGRRSKHLVDLQRYDTSYRDVLRQRLLTLPMLRARPNVLCLAARIGTEVKAFIDVGCFAVGIDLNPGPDNAYVVVGDFHQLQFADASVDVVFTNSLDHVFALDKVLGEVHRVLKPGGHFIAELMLGTEEGGQPKEYESMGWKRASDLIDEICAKGALTRLSREDFTEPWKGAQVVFQKNHLT